MAGAAHPVKTEVFDTDAMTNTDPKGCAREVEEYRHAPFGLYMARRAPGRAQFHYLESWLLPELGLRVTDFWFCPGYERDQDFYLDVVRIERAGHRWHSEDLYLDIVLRTGKDATVLDVDELLAAHRSGLLDASSSPDRCAAHGVRRRGGAGEQRLRPRPVAGHPRHRAWLAAAVAPCVSGALGR